MIILGLNPGYDSTAALVVDGCIAGIVEEERLSRVKMHLGFPRRAIQEVLRSSNVKPSEVELITFSFVDYLKAHPVITRLLLQDTGFPFDPENPIQLMKMVRPLVGAARLKEFHKFSPQVSSSRNYRRNEATYLEELRNLGIRADRLVAVDHHLSHSASAYFTSGFDDCLIVTADGCGDGHSMTISIGRNAEISRIAASPEDASAGMFYSSVTAFLGFRAHRHEGKITGLAAYGKPERCYDHFVPCLKLADDKRALATDLCNGSWIEELAHLGRVFSGRYYRKAIMNAYDQHYRKHLSAASREDIAAAAQKRLEDVFAELLTPILKETGLEKVALAGGVFGNVKLNQRIFEIEGVREIFVHPNMGDGGNALGSALHAHMKHRNSAPPALPARIEDVYFGPEYADPVIEDDLLRHNLVYRRCDNIEALVADRLADGEVVGRFNGRMEYGPRALGNRSILANPSDASINAILNHRLHRTEFMPFAPSVLAEDAQTYFDLSDGNLHAARFMTITCRVRPDKRDAIPAVCHVDGTARPNVVHRSTNESYYRILQEFKRRTGLSVIVNTSFNVHEEPIVCTPADACKALQQNAADALAIGNFMVDGGSRQG